MLVKVLSLKFRMSKRFTKNTEEVICDNNVVDKELYISKHKATIVFRLLPRILVNTHVYEHI